MAKKTKTRPGRGSDQFIVRMPPGMRDRFAKLSSEHGRSMNAEIVYALARYVEFEARAAANEEPLGEGADDRAHVLSEVGLSQISKNLLAGMDALNQLVFDVRDLDLEEYIIQQRAMGNALTRSEAIRKIVRAYLEEHRQNRR